MLGLNWLNTHCRSKYWDQHACLENHWHPLSLIFFCPYAGRRLASLYWGSWSFDLGSTTLTSSKSISRLGTESAGISLPSEPCSVVVSSCSQTWTSAAGNPP